MSLLVASPGPRAAPARTVRKRNDVEKVIARLSCSSSSVSSTHASNHSYHELRWPTVAPPRAGGTSTERKRSGRKETAVVNGRFPVSLTHFVSSQLRVYTDGLLYSSLCRTRWPVAKVWWFSGDGWKLRWRRVGAFRVRVLVFCCMEGGWEDAALHPMYTPI